MKKRFSSQTLYQLRNHLSIELLIRDLLLHPCKTSEGFFRFLCPLCFEFNSAVNPRTNLARCFACKTNFNTIEFTLATRRKLSFPQAVQFLINHLPKK